MNRTHLIDDLERRMRERDEKERSDHTKSLKREIRFCRFICGVIFIVCCFSFLLFYWGIGGFHLVLGLWNLGLSFVWFKLTLRAVRRYDERIIEAI